MFWAEVREITDRNLETTFADHGYAGEETAEAAAAHGIAPGIVKHPEAKRGFVLLPGRGVR